MSVYILGLGISHLSGLENLETQAPFRKSTRNMRLAYSALIDAGVTSTGPRRALIEDMGIVVGTSHGELGATTDFLECLAVQGMARPVLFQNSLHHSTLGFLTQYFGIRGPGFSVSNQYSSGEEALGLASLLLDQNVVSHCLVVGVDSLVAGLDGTLTKIYPAELVLGEGAGALWLANANALESKWVKPLAVLLGISFDVSVSESIGRGFYDSNAVELLARALQDSKDLSEVRLKKPNGTASCITFQRINS